MSLSFAKLRKHTYNIDPNTKYDCFTGYVWSRSRHTRIVYKEVLCWSIYTMISTPLCCRAEEDYSFLVSVVLK